MAVDETRRVIDIRNNETRDLALKEIDADPNYAQFVFVSNAADIGASASDLPANNVYGEVAALTGFSTAVIATIASTASTYRFRGFTVVAEGDCRITVEIAGSVEHEGRIDNYNKMIHVPLPNGLDTATGVAVELKVINLRGNTIRVAGTLLGAE